LISAQVRSVSFRSPAAPTTTSVSSLRTLLVGRAYDTRGMLSE
jgi:hypothetical protein